jgi:hypothetical protein
LASPFKEMRPLKLPGRLGDVRLAHRIREAGGFLQLEIEARLLARMTTSEIAECTGISQGVIEAYAALYYAVGEFLDNRPWILMFALDVPWPDPPPEGKLLRACAYFGGREVLEALLEYFSRRDLECDLTTVHGRLQIWMKLILSYHQAATASGLQPGATSRASGVPPCASNGRCRCRGPAAACVEDAPADEAEKPSPGTPPPGTANGRPARHDEPPVVPGFPPLWDDEDDSGDAEDESEVLRQFEEQRARYYGRA